MDHDVFRLFGPIRRSGCDVIGVQPPGNPVGLMEANDVSKSFQVTCSCGLPGDQLKYIDNEALCPIEWDYGDYGNHEVTVPKATTAPANCQRTTAGNGKDFSR